MMKPLHSFLIILALFSCTANNNKGTNSNSSGKPAETHLYKIDAAALTKDFSTWYTYTYNTILLSQIFIALDVDLAGIDKTMFLKKLATGTYVAFKTQQQNNIPVYQLFNLKTEDESISATIKQMAETEQEHVRLEGTALPDFNFKDVNGKEYNKANTSGKLLVLKCWFIHCVACVKEFPELDALVDAHKNYQDILFVSLAIDTKKELNVFLKKKPFKYAVVPKMETYMTEALKVSAYPTHILVNRNGTIVKVVNRIEELLPFIDDEKGKI